MRLQDVPAEVGLESAGADRADKATSLSIAMLLIGVVLLWPVPLGGALFVAAGGLGLKMTLEGGH